MLADITCDSDGKIEHFIDQRDVKDVLELHALNEDDYYLGIFLVGAYQEILGDLHNLFGDTHAVQVSLAPERRLPDRPRGRGRHGHRGAELRQLQQGRPGGADAPLHRGGAARRARITLDESRQLLRVYEDGLAGYTYLEREVDAPAAAMSGQPLRLVEKVEPGRSSTGT